MQVDERAPIVATASIDVDAPQEQVFDLLADVEGWPDWNPDVRSARLEGALAEGSSFRWRAGRTRLTSTFRVVDRPRELAWTGRTIGLTAVHTWRFERRGRRTRVTTEESFAGALARILRGPMRRLLEQTLARSLLVLKDEAERRVG